MKYLMYIVFVFFSLSVCCQESEKYSKMMHLTAEDGLSQNSIMAITRDDLGFMWIATKYGLNKFDGERFTIFQKSEKDSTTLSDNHILSLENDQGGAIWIGTVDGISRYDPTTQKINRLTAASIPSGEFGKILTICRARNGNVWFGSNFGLFVWDKKQHKIIKIQDSNTDIPNVIRGSVQKIFEDSENTIWIGTDQNLYKVAGSDIQDLRFSKIAHSPGIPNIRIQEIIEGPKGNLYIGTINNGVLIYDQNKKIVKKYKHNTSLDRDIRCLQFDLNQNLWVGSFSGLAIIHRNGKIIYPEYLTEEGEGISDGLRSFYMDPHGSLWMGGYSGGLKIWNDSFSSFQALKTLKPELDVDLGLVNAITEDRFGNIYFGTKKKGIIVLKKNKLINYKLSRFFHDKLSGTTVKTLLVDNDILWIGTRENGMLLFDLGKEKFLSNVLSDEFQNLYRNVKIYSISKSNQLLAIGSFGNGLLVYDLNTHKIYNTILNQKIDQNPLGNIRVVHFDQKANLWIGSSTGLKKVSSENLREGKLIPEEIKLVADQAHANRVIMSINENHNGQLMIGTDGYGFFIEVDGQMKKQPISVSGELVNYIAGAVEVESDQIWLASDKGIVKYDLSNKKVSTFDKNYGLSNTEFRNQSFLYGSDRNLYFGTSRGVVYFEPDVLKEIETSSTVVMTDFIVRGRGQEDERENQDRKKNIATINERLKLAYDENSFTIQFSSFNFTKTLNSPYEYRLVGLNNNWKLTSNPEVTYTLQKSGDYEFQVRRRGFSGDIKSDQITTFPIHLGTPPWKSWYAWTGYAILLVLGMVAVYRFLKSKTELKHQLELENFEKNKHKSQIEFFTNLSHDFRTPLTLILAPLHQLMERYEGSNTMYRKMMAIRRNADQLLHLVNQLLDFSKIEANTKELNIKEGNVVENIREVYLSFEEYAKIRGYVYTFRASSDYIPLFYDSLLLERVFYNLLSNAFKNTPKGGSIDLSIQDNSKTVRIQVKDSGKGIDVEFVNNIFTRFYQVADSPRFKENFAPGAGIGLHIAKKTIELHKGTIEVESVMGKGCVFTIFLKKGTHDLVQQHEGRQHIHSTKAVNLHTPILEANKKEVDVFLSEKKVRKDVPTILIVEDNNELRKFLVDILEKMYNVEQAADGRKGYYKALQKKIDLVISDIMMPGISGTELTYKLKNNVRTNHIPIILLTSRSSASQKMSGLESGADAYLTKPFIIKEFLLIVKNLLATYQYTKDKNASDTFGFFTEYTVDSDDEILFRKAMEIVHKNINNSSFEINKFSEELGVNRSKLFKKIKDWTGQTPKDFVQQIRLKKASELLELGELNVSDVCYEVGFASPNYFARCFKKQFHQTPSEYAGRFYKDDD